ncbi:3-epi-6-deoxocathasterone 23-monooxygenase CYP90C1 isoform X2 [Magnolia sinica]|uniref:3-epi-6-deoxocathasterone 23-monooxygenase CYP90C1 isoform X2 n=1 Tax=Magnolia sinica TaxID=86752 RepID=UPI00265846A1|nr:3-epi-6-deoxocathasterone 23-monooxygenase CYP90C1 isoform X2 [Magnolia sinica]
MSWVMGVWVLVGFGWCWLCWWRKKNEMNGERSGIPNGSMGWPFIGETLDFIASGHTSRPVSFMDKRRSLYGKVFKSHLLGRPIIISTDSEVNKVILRNDGRTFIPYYPKSVTELLGQSSILKINGNLQRRVHGLIGSFLKSPQLKTQITREIEECVELSIGNWKEGQLVHLQDETKDMTFQVLVRALMSTGPGEEMKFLQREFQEFVEGLICLPVKFPGTRLYKSLKAKKRLLKFVKSIVEEKMKRTEKDSVMDVIDVLLNETCDINEQQLSIDFICGNIIEMMIPGEDSVPMIMTLADENTRLKREKTHSGEPYTWTDYMSLPFTQNVINETLRMANIINGVWRKALKDVEIKGYLIPKSWCVLASFSSIHMDEGNYENPYQFNPWRWQGKEASISNNFTPFGGGQRLCPGLELARLEVSIFLHHFITRHRWVAEEDSIVNFPTVKMKRRLPIRVTPIST